MKTDSSQQELLGKLYGVWFRSYRLRANLKRFQHKKIQTEDINGVPVIQNETINEVPVIQNETINEVPVVQPVAAHFITHDPAEEEVAWMKNTLLGVINEATDLPITVWNVSSNNKIISAYGRAIGFDKINLWYSNLGHIDLLIGTRLNRFIKEHTTLWLNGKDYKIKLQELDPLHYLVSEAIEYSTAAFDLMKQEDESETDTLMLKMLTRLQLKAVHIWLI
ncbi:hypothetical protein NC653_004776 [Populus alba x Populus x berolinensis]|uniref:Uncharacterized protein n=2 Tax=Populus TaxID=3689 RepID=A0A4U5PTL0_POPAL|nr:hypothetical protein NC653_004776 [Populus alba x Populus x berolinensis]TKR98984.1 hypothetical protein D5086_0000197650 [Populus alba]